MSHSSRCAPNFPERRAPLFSTGARPSPFVGVILRSVDPGPAPRLVLVALTINGKRKKSVSGNPTFQDLAHRPFGNRASRCDLDPPRSLLKLTLTSDGSIRPTVEEIQAPLYLVRCDILQFCPGYDWRGGDISEVVPHRRTFPLRRGLSDALMGSPSSAYVRSPVLDVANASSANGGTETGTSSPVVVTVGCRETQRPYLYLHPANHRTKTCMSGQFPESRLTGTYRADFSMLHLCP